MSGARTEVALDQLLNELRYLFYFVHNRGRTATRSIAAGC
jgi:hypothetical protein